MNRYISPEVDARFEMLRSASPSIARSKSVINLTLIAFLKDNLNISSSGSIDSVFKQLAINQMKLFLFSNYDSIVYYILYILYLNSHILSRLREEYNDVIDSDFS